MFCHWRVYPVDCQWIVGDFVGFVVRFHACLIVTEGLRQREVL